MFVDRLIDITEMAEMIIFLLEFLIDLLKKYKY